MNPPSYVIRGGVAGRERLRLLARVLLPTTRNLLHRVGIAPGMVCLDAGCGGGDVTVELARLVGPEGRVVGTDVDEVKLDLARREAAGLGLRNVTFRNEDVRDPGDPSAFDAIYARFLLTHLPDPARALTNLFARLRPGGVLVVEDIDFAGHFCHPPAAAYDRYVELYTEIVTRRGGDPFIGPRLPRLLLEAGCEQVQMQVAHPAGLAVEIKLINAVTMENIAEAVVCEGLASENEVMQIIAALRAFAEDPATVASIARIVQAWGYRPMR